MRPAETFSVGSYIREEMEARGWDEATVADKSAITVETLRAVLGGTQPMTPGLAKCLGETFDVSPFLFINLANAGQ